MMIDLSFYEMILLGKFDKIKNFILGSLIK